MAVLRLIRWPNLLMLSVIMGAVYTQLIRPLSQYISFFQCALLILTTLCISAAGYIINDIQDRDVDRINRPTKQVLDQWISVSAAWRWYWIIILLGGVLSLFLAWQFSLWWWWPLYPMAIMGLRYYSVHLKCSPLAGNLIVSLYCAGAVFIVSLPDALMNTAFRIPALLWFYLVFAFLWTWYRELVKDLEDEEGDRTGHCETFVVRYGVSKARLYAMLLATTLLALLIGWDSTAYGEHLHFGLYMLQGGVLGSAAMIWWAKDKRYYRNASWLIKCLMVIGTGLLFFIP